MSEEYHIVFPALVVIPVLRQALYQLRHFRKTSYNYFASESIFSREHLLYVSFQLPCAAFIRFEQDISAVNVGAHIFEAHRLEARPEQTHADQVLAANIDTTQERNKTCGS